MHILPLNSINTNKFNNNKYSNNSVVNSNFGLKMEKPLLADTVSFKAKNTMLNFFEKQAAVNNSKLVGEATVYMDTLEAIANKLKDSGVSFNREYCEPNAIKSATSVVSKIIRAGVLKVPDRIRGTLYFSDIYNLNTLINKILPEFSKRGYVIAEVPMSIEESMKRGKMPTDEDIKKGYVLLPDMDLRLAGIAEKRNQLPENLKYSLGNPQPSGYEDIQIRFSKINDNVKRKKNENLHELIILIGPNYAQTKHDESEKIYKYTRCFKELNIFNKKDSNNIAIEKIKRYSDLVTKLFSTEITQKVYENAKNHDMYGISKEMPISLSKADEATLTNYYDAIESLTKDYYNAILSKKSNNKSYVARIKNERQADLEKLAWIRQGLTDAVDFYKNRNPKRKPKVSKNP
ncbi:MAG: hypothetical protein MJ230_05280 [bacterium]|nr:hypothetical protein [bacterium]